MRAFIAIELDTSMQQALAQMLRALQQANPPLKLKWVAPENQHFTLQFLGDIKPDAVNQIAQALQQAAIGIPPFELTLAQIGCFPNTHKPNVLWVGLQEPSGTLPRLHTAIGSSLGRIGFPPETRPFTPHLTLARVPRQAHPRERRALGEWFMKQAPPAPQTMRVIQLHFIQSELLPAGPRYTPLHAVKLSVNSEQ